MKLFKSILVAVLLVVFLVGCSISTNFQESIEKEVEAEEINTLEELTIEEKLEDFEYLFKVITENYPYLEVNRRIHGIDWVNNKDLYREWIMDTQSDSEFYDAMNLILRDLNDNHTDIIDGNFVEFVREVYDYVLMQYPENWRKMPFENLNNSLVTERYELEEFKVGELKNKEEDAEENQGISNARVQDIIKDKVAHITIPSMIQPYQRKSDEELIKGYLDQIKNYKVLIIDVRDNVGGNNSYWSDLLVPMIANKPYQSETYKFYRGGEIVTKYVEHQAKYEELEESEIYKISDLDKATLPMLPPEIHDSFEYYRKNTLIIEPNAESIKFKGNVYMLVNGLVYSSADSFAVFAKQSGFATLLGEKTLGGGIGSDPWIEMLPNSGYVFRFTKEMGTTADGTSNAEHKTTPHYEVEGEPMWNDLLNDASVKKILELEGLMLDN
ncbi:S41 family peptidase [Natronospora cellulosivora (SeqCode)]